MIKEVTYYDIICDRCGKSLINESETCYPDKDSALMVAEQSEWRRIGGKDYCPDCYELDEETDEYVPKKGDKMSKTNCGECEHFAPDFDPLGLFDGYCDLYERGRFRDSECYGR